MKNQNGYLNALLIPLIVAVMLTIGLAVTTVIYQGRFTDHRDNVDAKVAAAVGEAEAAQEKELRAQFEEERKSPYETYVSASSLGSLQVTYPRTWSAYVLEDEGGRTAVDGYFHPNFVPDTRSETRFATRLTLTGEAYSEVVADYDRQIEDGTLKARAVTVNDVKGLRLDGEIERDKTGAIVLLPLRDKTLAIWTENPDHIKDFTAIIIAKLKFNP